MSDELEPLSEQARALLGVERERPPAAEAERELVLERLVNAKAFAVSGTIAASAVTKAALAKVVVVVVAGTLVGAVAGGAGVHAVMSEKLERLRAELEAARSAPVAQVPLGAAPVSANIAPEAEAVVAPPPVRVRPAKSPDPVAAAKAPPVLLPNAAPSTLRDESALIEQARTALLKGDFANATVALASYGERFPAGHLIEEQQLLAIQVLLGQRRYDDAHIATEAFRRAHPGSPLIPALNSLSEDP